MKRIALLLLVVAACSRKKDEPKAPPPTPGSAVAASPMDAAPPPVKTETLPAKIEATQGVVFAEKQGEQVTATVKGQSVLIPDGTKVVVVGEKEPAAESGEDTSVTVTYEGKDVVLRADRVLREGLLQRSPDGAHAVFSAITTCGDLCHSMIYLVSADGRRTKLGEGGPDVTVAWTKDAVAVGSGSLVTATLADHAPAHHEGYTSPAYAPDGTLYVRDTAGAAFTLAGDKATRVWKPKAAKRTSEDMRDPDPAPVAFDAAGKPKFE